MISTMISQLHMREDKLFNKWCLKTGHSYRDESVLVLKTMCKNQLQGSEGLNIELKRKNILDNNISILTST